MARRLDPSRRGEDVRGRWPEDEAEGEMVRRTLEGAKSLRVNRPKTRPESREDRESREKLLPGSDCE